jgi:hypothetical protein
MKDFSRHSYNFTTIAPLQKIIYTTFLVFTLLGFISIWTFYLAKTGIGPSAIVDYYRGNEEKILFAKTFQELWEVTHFHLFSVPLIYMVLAHLLALTRLSNRTKGLVMIGGALGILLDISAGWLIVYAAPGFVVFKIIGRLLLTVSFLAFLMIPVYEMWFKKHKPRHR